MNEKEKKQIEATDLVLIPVARPDDIILSIKNFQEIKMKLLDKNDYYDPDGRGLRIRKAGWRKLALAFGLNDEIVDEKIENNPLDSNEIIIKIRVRVWAKSGRSVEAVGSASSKERKFSHFWHDLHALAHTRAKSRAISDILGSGDFVAEEMDDEMNNDKLFKNAYDIYYGRKNEI